MCIRDRYQRRVHGDKIQGIFVKFKSMEILPEFNLRLKNHESWGPAKDFTFQQYLNLPFAPFNKLEKISQPMDVTSYGQKLAHQSGLKGEEEEDFTMVEGKATMKTNRNLIGGRARQLPRRRVYPRPTNLVSTQNYYPQRNQRQTNTNPRYNRQTTVKTKFKESANVTTDWENINEISKMTVEKITVAKISVEDIRKSGSIKEYDRAMDRINPNNERPLISSDGIQISNSTFDDKVLIDIIEQELNTDKPTVYTTDVILAAIMTLKTSVFPWEIAITKEKNQIILSRQETEREDKSNTSYIDLQTVIENTAGNLPEEEKILNSYCREATHINQNFITQSTSKGEAKVLGPQETSDRKGYLYRRWNVDGVSFVVRCEVDSYLKSSDGREELVQVRALNEFDLTQDWRKRIEREKGALLSTELRNNSCKISRWICQAYLADVEKLKIGLVSRIDPKDQKRHSILGVESFARTNLESTIAFKVKDNWNLLKYIVDFLIKQEDGRYAFIKPAYKQSLKLYKVHQKKEDDELQFTRIFFVSVESFQRSSLYKLQRNRISIKSYMIQIYTVAKNPAIQK
eukprot:TRINITY_DN1101_c0_g1_i3.p1 TRINITY_DN1101_c0_g1~~TRINITY_DN1101_c0_g1_i3.p1  ORF type:complete len:573 (+),score=159.39 TRINITY_DN1101_c0_g1_i3:67-1785(+)